MITSETEMPVRSGIARGKLASRGRADSAGGTVRSNPGQMERNGRSWGGEGVRVEAGGRGRHEVKGSVLGVGQAESVQREKPLE